MRYNMILMIEEVADNYGIKIDTDNEEVLEILSDFIDDELIELIINKLESLVK